MKQKKMMVLPVLAVWAVLVCGAWFLPDGDISEAERRPLAQRPALTAEALRIEEKLLLVSYIEIRARFIQQYKRSFLS